MVELISKISKGSIMDQIYIPKNRESFPVGSYVVVKGLELELKEIKPVFYHLSYLEPVKIQIIKQIMKTLPGDNIIVTGSFLDRGFRFNDIDLIVIAEKNLNLVSAVSTLEKGLGVKIHAIVISNQQLITGLATDPLYKNMLSKCVAKKRFLYRHKIKINFKLLDLHLLKSRLLIDNFELMNGFEKYEMVRNLISIKVFLEKKPVNKEYVDAMINKIFGEDSVENLKNNMVGKEFLNRYKKEFTDTQNKILQGIQNGSKQK